MEFPKNYITIYIDSNLYARGEEAAAAGEEPDHLIFQTRISLLGFTIYSSWLGHGGGAAAVKMTTTGNMERNSFQNITHPSTNIFCKVLAVLTEEAQMEKN